MVILGVIALLALITAIKTWGVPGRLDNLENRVGFLQIGVDSLRSDSKTINDNVVAAHQDLVSRSDGLQKIVVDRFNRTDAALKNVATKSDVRRLAARRSDGDLAALRRIERQLKSYDGLRSLQLGIVVAQAQSQR